MRVSTTSIRSSVISTPSELAMLGAILPDVYGAKDRADKSRGHLLGSHTWSHRDMATLSEAELHDGTSYHLYPVPAPHRNSHA